MSKVEYFRANLNEFASDLATLIAAPTCKDAEFRYKQILEEGIRGRGGKVFDPLFNGYQIGSVLKMDVVFPKRWFGVQTVGASTVFAKAMWEETKPQPATRTAIYPGAISGLVEVEESLYLARKEQNRFVVTRPVFTEEKEVNLRKLLLKKTPEFFAK